MTAGPFLRRFFTLTVGGRRQMRVGGGEEAREHSGPLTPKSGLGVLFSHQEPLLAVIKRLALGFDM